MQVQFEGSEALQGRSLKDDVADALTEAIVSAPLPRPAGLPLVDDWNCLRVSSCMFTSALLALFPISVSSQHKTDLVGDS